MSLFGSISEIIAGLSPRRQQPANRQQPARRRDYSDSTRRTSLTPTNRIISAQNEFTFGSNSKSDDPHDNHSQPAHDSAASSRVRSFFQAYNPPYASPLAALLPFIYLVRSFVALGIGLGYTSGHLFPVIPSSLAFDYCISHCLRLLGLTTAPETDHFC